MTKQDPIEIYQSALKRGKFLLQQCRDCGLFNYPPSRKCPHCAEFSWVWREPTGKAVLQSFVLLAPVLVGIPPVMSPRKVIAQLEEGPKIAGYVGDVDNEKLYIGMLLSAHVGRPSDSEPLQIVFYNKEQGSREW